MYIPDVIGRERRKDIPSKEGKLGVEGMETNALLEAFQRAGVVGGEKQEAEITKLDLFQDGFSGTAGCRGRYQALLKALHLPEHLSTNVFCACVGREEYEQAREKLRAV